MTCKKLLALLCAFMMMMSIPVASAENTGDFASFTRIPNSLYYKGGVVMRGFVKGADTASLPLELAYVLTSMPYIILGQKTTWEVTISGGEGPYMCEAVLAYQEFSKRPFEDSWDVPDWFDVEDGSFDYTFTKEGRYFWEFRVMDENGQFFNFQTRIYETYTEADESDTQTTVGKANSVVAEVVKPEMSDYARALALHDWLIYNANYDYSDSPYRDASGVLLHGRGVCDSYARAYLMLCTIAGIECIYLSGDGWNGYAWGAHGWNMVKLDGKWYHVDCTWDDPNEGGGYERHDYFCVDDETMAKDHRWNRPDNIYDDGYIPPESEDGEYENTGKDDSATYDFTFSTWEEFFEKFDQLVAAGDRREKTYGLYTGSLSSREMYSTMGTYSNAKTQELYDKNLANGGGRGYSGKVFYYWACWYEPTQFITISDTSLRVSINAESLIFPTEYYPLADVFTWTSSAPDVATVSAVYDEELGLVATVKGVSAGTAIITATAPNGKSDSVTVTVLPAYKPDFEFELEVVEDEIELDWASIPGVTEYQIIHVLDGVETILGTTTDTEYDLDSDQLPNDVQQQVYILGLRKVAGTVMASYKSDPVTYGKLTLDFNSSLPEKMETIGPEAFADCTHLTSFDIPSKVSAIGERAFAGCTALTTVHIPASVTSIGANAFDGCPLKYVQVEEGSYADSWMQQHYPDIQLVY